MKARPRFGILFALALIFAWSPIVFCQGPPGGMGAGPMYNPKTESTLSGRVGQVTTMQGPRGWGGTHLDLKTESGTYHVHLGPTSFIKAKGFTFTRGDQIEVTGSKVTFQNHDAIIAREVKKGDKVLSLRDAQGIPEWSGGRRHRAGPGAP